MNKTCPKCGSMSIGDRGLLYYCGNKSTGVYETRKCIEIQRDQLLAQNVELTERIKQLSEAGNDLVWWFCQGEPSQLSPVQSVALKQWRDLRGGRNP